MFNSNDFIIFGDVHKIDGINKENGGTYIVLQVKKRNDRPDNTIYFNREKMLEKSSVYILVNDKKETLETSLSVDDILKCNFTEHFELVKDFERTIVPLFYLRETTEKTVIYSQLRFTNEDMIFIKTKDIAGSSDINELISAGLEVHAENCVFLGNHQCYYRKMESAKEIEYKFNMKDNADPWVLIKELFNDTANGKLEDYIFEYRDDFQKWDYMNYMFKIYGDETEKGYISFIPQTNGKYLIKRKIYQRDQMSRIEIHYKNVSIDCPLREYIENEFNLHDYYEFPPFRRIRYDINIENCRTGNVHGIFFDYITVEGHDQVLKQCEIEYLRTRSLFDNNEYREELEHLNNYMKNFFNERSIKYEETFYSKLSFMSKVCNVSDR